MKIIDWCIDRWLQACKHHGDHVAADILEGIGGKVEVKYCRRCGAVRPSYSIEWRRPRPLWPLTMTQGTMQEAACVYGNCHRCGGPKAPTIIGCGGTMLLCTRCTSKEDQDAQTQFEEQIKRLNGEQRKDKGLCQGLYADIWNGAAQPQNAD